MNPRSRMLLTDALKNWAALLTAREIGIKGKVEYLNNKETRSSCTIRVTDDKEKEVIEYTMSIKENNA